MPNFVLPEGASPARQPTEMRLRIVTPSPAPPVGENWLHEIKHDGHRLVAFIDDGGRLRLISRNGHNRTEALGAPFGRLAAERSRTDHRWRDRRARRLRCPLSGHP
jgi:ATP-dependent DNA ligase